MTLVGIMNKTRIISSAFDKGWTRATWRHLLIDIYTLAQCFPIGFL